MSKQSKQLANAERIADEAIASRARLNEAYKDLAGCLPTQTQVEQRIQHYGAEVLRLHAELEGEG